MVARGFVLPLSLILLLALTLVATGALRASGQESQLSGHAVEKAEAFECSESVRRLFEPVLHAALDGDTPSVIAAATSGWTLADPTGASLSVNDDEADHCATAFVDTAGSPCILRADATYERNLAEPGEPTMMLRGEIAVFRMRTAETGESYYYIESRSTPGTPTRVVTAAIVRHVPKGSTAKGQNGEIDWRERRS